MFIAGGLTLHLFSHTLMDLGSTPHQQMDLTVEPVYRRLYKFSQLTPFGSDAQSNVDGRRHRPKTSTKYRTPKTSTKYRTHLIRPISKGL